MYENFPIMWDELSKIVKISLWKYVFYPLNIIDVSKIYRLLDLVHGKPIDQTKMNVFQ